MKSVRSELVSLTVALALPVSVALVFPYSALRRASVAVVRDSVPFAAFVSLTADEEARAMRRAKSAGRGGEAADARIRPDDLVLGTLPDDPPTPIGRIEERARLAGPGYVTPAPSPYWPSCAAPAPVTIAPAAETDAAADPFSRQELLRLE